MGEMTGIAWTDSTMNWWEGCTKVGPGCDHCYAATRDIRYHEGAHWGAGAPRRRMSEHTRNNLKRWQKSAAPFLAEHGHPRRVFCSSLSDILDNEVPDEWRAEAFSDMEAAPDLRIQICTKRVSNLEKMVPAGWMTYWPRNVGVLITVVTPEEVLRDVPRLLGFKRAFGIPWVGLSVEPMIADVELENLGTLLAGVDWAIFGGESGAGARPYDLAWMRKGLAVCHSRGVAVFHKQMGDNPHIDGERAYFTGKGDDPDEWPSDVAVREFPPALCG